MKLGMTTFTISRPFPRFLKFTSLWSMELQTKCRTPWMFGSSTFQQLGLKFVCKNGGNLMDRIAIYLWLVKILFSLTGVRHYAQHSDVEAVSWMTNIGAWIIRNYKFSSLTLRNHECWRLDGSASTSDTLHCIHITTILVIFITIIYLFIIVFLNLIFLLDLHPCIDIECEKFAHCVAISPHEYTCRCNTSCPSYEEQVCASNGRTFSNLCLLNKEICDTDANFTIYHPGSCTGISLVATSYSWCEWCTKKRLSCI